jgi:hypothetical protein
VHIDIIETSPSLAGLEDNWNAVYDADDEAQVFLSCESLGQHEEALRQHLEFMRLTPDQPDGFVAVARCMAKLGRMAEVNAALLAAIEPASAPSVRNRREWRPAQVQQTASEQSVSA